jgi:hypothetical protein
MGYSRKEHMLDLTVASRLVGPCWLLAGVGIATLQMRLLAMVWHESGQALITALAASAWMLGSVANLLRPSARRTWGACFAAAVLVWCLSPLLSLRTAPAFLPSAPLFALFAAALVLGFCSTAWLTQRRFWPPVGERVALSRALVSGLAGLVLVWLLPNPLWSGAVGFALLIPLLALDSWPQGSLPLPMPGGPTDRLFARTARRTAGLSGPRLDRGALTRGWWLRYLAARQRLPLTLLASGSAVVLGGIWNAIPTPFAAQLTDAHQLSRLVWLLGGQLAALAVGFSGLAWRGRGEVGAPNRLLSEAMQARARSLVILLLMAMFGALAALGLPFLQDPGWLAASVGIYTLAALLWGALLPRMRPAISTETTARRHLYRHPSIPRLLPLRQSEEDLANRCVLIAEALLTAVLTPILGWAIDLLTVDRLLVCLGGGLLAALSVASIALLSGSQPRQVELQRWLGGNGALPIGTPFPLPPATDEVVAEHPP